MSKIDALITRLEKLLEEAKSRMWLPGNSFMNQQQREECRRVETAIAHLRWELHYYLPALLNALRVADLVEPELSVGCECSVDYTRRKLIDPMCAWHDQKELREAVAQLKQHLREE